MKTSKCPSVVRVVNPNICLPEVPTSEHGVYLFNAEKCRDSETIAMIPIDIPSILLPRPHTHCYQKFFMEEQQSSRYCGHGGHDPERPVKRRKIALACDECRSRKVRCDGGHPGVYYRSSSRKQIRCSNSRSSLRGMFQEIRSWRAMCV